LASNPPIPPRFELDKEELLWGLGWRDPPYQHEHYSLADVRRELGIGKAATGRSLVPKTKTTLPVPELLTELQRMSDAGELTSSWNEDSGRLSIWCSKAHPKKPCAHSTIRGNPILKAEHDRLTGQGR
jgi:hypothetical protein